jgi:lysophospholipase L1-like esterase
LELRLAGHSKEGAMRHLDSEPGGPHGVGVITLVLVLGMLLGWGGTGGKETASAATPPEGYYLALGDSITYGIQPTKVKAGARATAFRTGYVDVFAKRLRKISPGIQVVNYGCPGESTVTFVRGGCPAFADKIELHDAFRGSQLAAALAFLRAHPGDVSPITVTLYGNDWLPVLLDTCKGEVACVRKKAPTATASFGSRLGSILRRLRTTAPNAEIVVTGAWNPDPSRLEQLKAVYRSLEASIVHAAAGRRMRVARMLPVFNPPRNGQARLCAFTFICSKGDPHPTDAGYRAMAAAVAAAYG